MISKYLVAFARLAPKILGLLSGRLVVVPGGRWREWPGKEREGKYPIMLLTGLVGAGAAAWM